MTGIHGAAMCICGHTRNCHAYGWLAGSGCTVWHTSREPTGTAGITRWHDGPCPCQHFTQVPGIAEVEPS